MNKGDMVVCIADDWIFKDKHPEIRFPVRGCVYTIEWIGVETCSYGRRAGELHTYLRFEELKNPIATAEHGTGIPMWHVDSFRPVKRTDISSLVPQMEDA